MCHHADMPAGHMRKLVLTIRYTVRPGRYKVFHEREPMGLMERHQVRLAAKRATVPEWLRRERVQGRLDDWADVRVPPPRP